MYEKYVKARDALGMNDNQVSKLTGGIVSNTTLSAWKKGTYTPKVDKLILIAKALGKPVEYFLG